MNLTDSEIMMLEQLTYVKGVDAGDKGKTVGEILSGYTEEKLSEMDPEKAAVIRYLQNSENLQDLVLDSTMTDSDGKTLALCFTQPGNPSDAVVLFKGTTSKEWGDNIEGLNETDTERQKAALDYIESLPYNNITVGGHSKGGNKAMYVAITSDKVNRCVSMDGQGFSEEFMEKYAAEIEENGHKIKNYSVSSDYVHVLLFQVPGSQQIYCEGYRIDDAGSHHEPDAFFPLDEDGNIMVDENGKPIVITERDGEPIKEDPSVIMLHDFTTFVLNIASPEDKEKIVQYIATAMDMKLGDECSMEELIQYLLSDPEALSLVLAYLVKYMETYDLTTDDIDDLLEMLGLNALDEYISVEVGGKTYGLSDLIELMLKNLTDGEEDKLIGAILAAISWVLGKAGYKIDIKKVWNDAEKKINQIGDVSKEEGRKEPSKHGGKVRDFSIAKYEGLMSAINKIDNLTFESVEKWAQYDSEDWYDDLKIDILRRAISAYYTKLQETNEVCKLRIEDIFDRVEAIDRAAMHKNLVACMERSQWMSNIRQIIDTLNASGS